MPFASNIANSLLSTPLDNKAINPYGLVMTLPEILQDYYANPIFHEVRELRVANDETINVSDASITQTDMTSQMITMSTEERLFETWLSDYTNNKVYTLSGNAGTGKTTYLHHLKYYDSKDANWTILDVSIAPISIDWYDGEKTNINNFNQAYNKVRAVILREIRSILFPALDSNDKVKATYCNVKEIVENYIDYHNSEQIASNPLFETIARIIKRFERRLFSKPYSVCLHQIAACCVDYFDSPKAPLFDELDVLFMTLLCCKKWGKKHIIVFDNLERFIAMDELYNAEIDDLRKKLATYITTINEAKGFAKHFKIIMAIRCSTARMCGVKLHSADEKASNLDISSWFNIEDIIIERIKYYNSKHISNPHFSLVQQIAGDMRKCRDDTITGLELLFSPLFNNNKRLIIDFLGIIIENIDNIENYPYDLALNKYAELWRLDTSLSRCGARNIIKGIILYKLKNSDNLFMHLKMCGSKTDDEDTGLDVSRRFLTTTYNLTEAVSKDEVLLIDVLSKMYSTSNILKIWHTNDFSSVRKTISEMLYYMNSYNRRTNDWIQFIDVQVDNEGHTLSIDSQEELEDVINNRLQNIHISLMPAGIAYLKYIMTSFEYFSALYCKEYRPIYSIIPDEDEFKKVKQLDKLACYQIIITVRESVNRYIRGIKSNRLIMSGSAKMKFSEQLILAHTQYLDNFIAFIMDSYVENEKISKEARKMYLDLARNIAILRKNYIISTK